MCAVICTPGRQIASFSTNNYTIQIAQSFLLTGVALRLCEHEGRLKDFKFVICTINTNKLKKSVTRPKCAVVWNENTGYQHKHIHLTALIEYVSNEGYLYSANVVGWYRWYDTDKVKDGNHFKTKS